MPTTKVAYLDNNSTTPTDPRVVEAMLPYFTELYANPASGHRFGISVQNQIKKARTCVSDLIGSEPSDIVFTNGATESINIALLGYALMNSNRGRHLITVNTEHKAVLETFKHLESVGFQTTYISVDAKGNIDLNEVSKALRPDTILFSAMLANNETGTILPIKEITDRVRLTNAIMFCDATQAVGKIHVDVEELGIDMMAFSGHKFYGPKGIGGLYVRDRKRQKIKLQSIQFGGGQEEGLKSGTQNVPAIIGIGKACELSMDNLFNDKDRITRLRDFVEQYLLEIPNSFVNGDVGARMYNVTNICFPRLDANAFVSKTQDIAISNGSACTSAIVEPSHVLKAMGLSDEHANSSIRFSLGRFTTEDEILSAVKIIKDSIAKELIAHAKVN